MGLLFGGPHSWAADLGALGTFRTTGGYLGSRIIPYFILSPLCPDTMPITHLSSQGSWEAGTLGFLCQPRAGLTTEEAGAWG